MRRDDWRDEWRTKQEQYVEQTVMSHLQKYVEPLHLEVICKCSRSGEVKAIIRSNYRRGGYGILSWEVDVYMSTSGSVDIEYDTNVDLSLMNDDKIVPIVRSIECIRDISRMNWTYILGTIVMDGGKHEEKF